MAALLRLTLVLVVPLLPMVALLRLMLVLVLVLVVPLRLTVALLLMMEAQAVLLRLTLVTPAVPRLMLVRPWAAPPLRWAAPRWMLLLLRLPLAALVHRPWLARSMPVVHQSLLLPVSLVSLVSLASLVLPRSRMMPTACRWLLLLVPRSALWLARLALPRWSLPTALYTHRLLRPPLRPCRCKPSSLPPPAARRLPRRWSR
jgi:hypothetical protein